MSVIVTAPTLQGFKFPKPSETRWWSWWEGAYVLCENFKAIYVALGDYVAETRDSPTATEALQLIEINGFEIAVELAVLMDIGYYLCVETYYMEADGPRFQYVYDRLMILHTRITNDATLVNYAAMIAEFGVDDDPSVTLWTHEKSQRCIQELRSYFYKLWVSDGMLQQPSTCLHVALVLERSFNTICRYCRPDQPGEDQGRGTCCAASELREDQHAR
jgi:hypothetical protein